MYVRKISRGTIHQCYRSIQVHTVCWHLLPKSNPHTLYALMSRTRVRVRDGDVSNLNDTLFTGIVLTTDLDAMFHMNNSRYLRECDLAQTKLWLESQVVKTIGQRFHVTNAATNIRFRRSLVLFTRYQIVSRFIYWDEKAFYIEQRFVRQSDGFVCAVNICKQATVGCTPASMVQCVDDQLKSPPATEELLTMMDSWRLSSERLRKSS
ncbi:protein THEM6-like [Argopecten irradians]|uniref:protein THEM6-like n=1 Tax=Argopecten irradians TaxID=31199 RepID=UPI003715E878